MSRPTLIVVTGMPGAGKTTVTAALAEELQLPLVQKDAIKERLLECVGASDVKESQRLGGASFELIFEF